MKIHVPQGAQPFRSMQVNPSPPQRPEVRAFWTGPRLSPYEELSLLSFATAGARVMLYSNDMTLRVPDGVELIDVNDLLPQQTHRFSYEDGDQCLTPHSDVFRYMAIERHGGWYCDLDIICAQNRLPERKIYVARESDQLINAAVMKFPVHSPVLTAAIEEALRLWPKAGRLTIGPELFTRLVEEYALDHLVLPRSSAYEIGTTEILAMFDPHAREGLEERVSQSDFIHLWNEIWRRLRIPKIYGPPEGSFLDGLFRRFDIIFKPEARLPLEALETWQRERHLLAQVAARLDTETVPSNAFGLLLQQLQQRGAASHVDYRPETAPLQQTHKPVNPERTVRTLWNGSAIGPYPLMCLRSFVDRGYRVDVYSYDSSLELPHWLSRKDASEILDAGSVIRNLPDQQGVAINADLFRLTLLHKIGGWWVDPDVVLLGADLPPSDMFIGPRDDFDRVSTAMIKFPAGHPALSDALQRIARFENAVAEWDSAGPRILGQVLNGYGLNGTTGEAPGNPISWFGVLDLFDPSKADEVALRCAGKPFLDLHRDVWLRAGIPDYLGPPPGSFLDRLFRQHRIGFQFAEHMEFADARRWIIHMYECLRLRAAGQP